MNKGERAIVLAQFSSLARSAFVAILFGLFLIAVSVNAQTVPAQVAKTDSTKKEGSTTQIKKAPNTTAVEDKAIRPFRVNIPEEVLIDLRRGRSNPNQLDTGLPRQSVE